MATAPANLIHGRRRVLFMEEKGVLADNVIECLGNHEFQCRYVENGSRPLTEADLKDVDVILVGLHGNNSHRMSLLHDVSRVSGDRPVIVISSIGKPPTQTEVLAAGGSGLVTKPFRIRELIAALDSSEYQSA